MFGAGYGSMPAGGGGQSAPSGPGGGGGFGGLLNARRANSLQQQQQQQGMGIGVDPSGFLEDANGATDMWWRTYLLAGTPPVFSDLRATYWQHLKVGGDLFHWRPRMAWSMRQVNAALAVQEIDDTRAKGMDAERLLRSSMENVLLVVDSKNVEFSDMRPWEVGVVVGGIAGYLAVAVFSTRGAYRLLRRRVLTKNTRPFKLLSGALALTAGVAVTAMTSDVALKVYREVSYSIPGASIPKVWCPAVQQLNQCLSRPECEQLLEAEFGDIYHTCQLCKKHQHVWEAAVAEDEAKKMKLPTGETASVEDSSSGAGASTTITVSGGGVGGVG